MKIGQVQNIANINSLKSLKIGQQLSIKVISKDEKGNGVISISGKHIHAKLDILTSVGETFNAIVKEINSESITLAKMLNPLNIDDLPSRLESRVWNKNHFLRSILQDFAIGQLNIRSAINHNPYIKTVVPQWENISSSSIVSILQNLFKALGIDYERRIYKLCKYNFSEIDYENELTSLRSSFKGSLIHAAKKQTISESSQEALNSIISQQIWLLTGSNKNSYFLLGLPYYDGAILKEARIAVESSKKGIKVDQKHCHVGIELETENLGTLGADIWLYEEQIHIRILCDSLKLHDEILKSFFSQARVQFEKIGLNLMTLRLESLASNKKFYKFVRGECVNGVDFRG